MKRTLDTDKAVYFYEQEFYVLSNFSSFQLDWAGYRWQTSEHAYQAQKFPHHHDIIQAISNSRSAHEAFKIAQDHKSYVIPGWDDMKLRIMKNILIAKCVQHEYVSRKLLETGDRLLVENSWRDSFWGEGEDGKGENHLGKLWMEVRAEFVKGKENFEAAQRAMSEGRPRHVN